MYWFNLTLQAPKKVKKNGYPSPNNNGAAVFLACSVEIKFVVIIFGRKNGFT